MTCCSLIASRRKRRRTPMSDAALRPEVQKRPQDTQGFGIIETPLTVFERLYNQVWLRKCFIILVLIVAWETYARHLDNPLLVPTFSETITAWWGGVTSGVLPDRVLTSLKVLALGFSTGVTLAAI